MFNPLDENLPLFIVLKEPITDNLLASSDLKDPFKYHFHPHVVRHVLANNFF